MHSIVLPQIIFIITVIFIFILSCGAQKLVMAHKTTNGVLQQYSMSIGTIFIRLDKYVLTTANSLTNNCTITVPH